MEDVKAKLETQEKHLILAIRYGLNNRHFSKAGKQLTKHIIYKLRMVRCALMNLQGAE